jgi:serine/threonine-protein kinase
MSTVNLAVDENLQREVAVKILAEHLAHDDGFVERFQREARSAARLVHPNIVQVFDYGRDERSGRHYIVMEYVPGESCAEVLRERHRVAVADAVHVIGQACRGLDYAHRNGVVHRDVKPGNLLVTADGHVKLADFGIAKAAEQSSITQVGSVLGTAAYLAPEQARGEEAGPPADIYGLGVVTYQLMSGRLPYEAQSLTELALKQQRELPPLLNELNPEVAPALAQAVARALALEPEQRYPNALAMEAALEAGARGVAPDTAATAATRVAGARNAGGRVGPRRPPPIVAPPVTPPPGYPPLEPGRGRARRRGRGRQVVAVLLVLGALGGGAAWTVSQLQTGVRLRPVSHDSVQRAIDDLRTLIDENRR